MGEITCTTSTLEGNWKGCRLLSVWASRVSASPTQHRSCRSLLEWNFILLSVKIFSDYWSRSFYGNWYSFISVMDYRGKLQGALRSRSFLRHGAGQGAGLQAASCVGAPRVGAPCVPAHGWGWQNGEQSSREKPAGASACQCFVALVSWRSRGKCKQRALSRNRKKGPDQGQLHHTPEISGVWDRTISKLAWGKQLIRD